MERPVLYETVSSGLAAESRDNVRFEVTDVSTRLQGCPSRVSSFRFLPLVREEAGALHVGQTHRRVIQDRQLRHQVAFCTSLDSQAGVR